MTYIIGGVRSSASGMQYDRTVRGRDEEQLRVRLQAITHDENVMGMGRGQETPTSLVTPTPPVVTADVAPLSTDLSVHPRRI